MIYNEREAADRFVTREGLGICTTLLVGILESRDDKGKIPSHKPFHKYTSVHVFHSQPKPVSLELAFNERPEISTGNEIDIQHHHKFRSRVQPSQISPSVELPRPFRHLEWRENQMDVDVG